MAETDTKEAPATKPDGTAGQSASKVGTFFEKHKKAIYILAGLFVLIVVYFLIKSPSSSSTSNPATNPTNTPTGVDTSATDTGVGTQGPASPTGDNSGGTSGMLGPSSSGGGVPAFGGSLGSTGSISSSFIPNLGTPTGFIPSQIGSINAVNASSSPPVVATQTGGNLNAAVQSPVGWSTQASPPAATPLQKVIAASKPGAPAFGYGVTKPAAAPAFGYGVQPAKITPTPAPKVTPLVVATSKATPGLSVNNAARLLG